MHDFIDPPAFTVLFFPRSWGTINLTVTSNPTPHSGTTCCGLLLDNWQAMYLHDASQTYASSSYGSFSFWTYATSLNPEFLVVFLSSGTQLAKFSPQQYIVGATNFPVHSWIQVNIPFSGTSFTFNEIYFQAANTSNQGWVLIMQLTLFAVLTFLCGMQQKTKDIF